METKEQESTSGIKTILKIFGILIYLGFYVWCLYVFWITAKLDTQQEFVKLTLRYLIYTILFSLFMVVIELVVVRWKLKKKQKKEMSFPSGLLKLGIINLLIGWDFFVTVSVVYRNFVGATPELLYVKTMETVPMSFFMLLNLYMDIRIVTWIMSDIHFFVRFTQGKVPFRTMFWKSKALTGWIVGTITAVSFTVIIVIDLVFVMNVMKGLILGGSLLFVLIVGRWLHKKTYISIN